MFRNLRLRLTLLYLSIALLLIVLMAGGTYKVIEGQLSTSVELALQHKMAHELRLLDQPIPPELVAVDVNWHLTRQKLFPMSRDANDRGVTGPEEIPVEEAYDSEMAAAIVLPLTADGSLMGDKPAPASLLEPDTQAVMAAAERGLDWRTTQLENGPHVRLLTYRLPPSAGKSLPAFLQIARILEEHDTTLSDLLFVLAVSGAVCAILMSIGGWWLAGRSLRPAQLAMDHQQTFVANASHELRMPLTLIRASTEVILRRTPAADEDKRSLLGDVLLECDHMKRLVEDLLLLSQIDAGRLQLQHSEIQLESLLCDLERQFKPLADDKGISLTIGDVHQTVWGDLTRLRQVLLILLDNALRHTPAGGDIRASSSSEGSYVAIKVADSGEGIAPDDLPHVFERFYRIKDAPSESRNAGLGLAIAKVVIEAQGGKISIQSQSGVGTEVTIVLPAANPSPNK